MSLLGTFTTWNPSLQLQMDKSVDYSSYNSDNPVQYEVVDTESYHHTIDPSDSSSPNQSFSGGIAPFPQQGFNLSAVFKWQSWQGYAITKLFYYLALCGIIFVVTFQIIQAARST